MKKIFCLLSLILLLPGCGSKPAPQWIESGHKQLETFKQDFLTGRVASITESHFRRSVEEIKKSGDTDLLEKAWLTRMALQAAVLTEMDAGEYLKLEAVQRVPGNRAFYLFLKGEQTDVSLLPASYRPFWTAFGGGDVQKMTVAISAIDDPLSRLIAGSLVVRRGWATEAILLKGVDDASQQGWKRALLAWLEQLKSFHEAAGEAQKAAVIAARIDLIR